jgi:uncharacterized membrane-anchored protein
MGFNVPVRAAAQLIDSSRPPALEPTVSGVTVNYTIRLLGRTGVMNAVLVSSPSSLDNDIKAFKASLGNFSFTQGQRYSEFRAGDKVAEYGLAALIVGGAAAAAAKSGAFKAFGKFIVFGVFGGLAAAWAAIRPTRCYTSAPCSSNVSCQ